MNFAALIGGAAVLLAGVATLTDAFSKVSTSDVHRVIVLMLLAIVVLLAAILTFLFENQSKKKRR